MAAGTLLVQEAGGKLSDFSGNSFSVYQKEVVARNGLIHPEMIEVLKIK
jgi:myo-inositol-1(or 4)-monophosphatase